MSSMAIYTPVSGSQDDSRRMKLVYFSNEFPNDDLQDLFRRLHNRSKDRRHTILARFIEEATSALRDEIRLLPGPLKSSIPPFETIFELANHPDLRTGPPCGSVEGILLTVVELATLIGHYEISPNEYDFESANTFLAGLGIGLLVSAALSLSPTLADIPRAGAEVVRLAFRLGVLVNDVSENLEPRDFTDSPDSWAYVVPDATADAVQMELDAIQTNFKTPEASKIFISALSQTAVTVSGPPSRLKILFRNSDFFRDRKFVALPVFGGLCHAKHVYTEHNVQSVIETSSMELLNTFPPALPIFSTSKGTLYQANTARELFEQVITEILMNQIKWDNVILGVVEQASSIAASECQVLAFGLSLPIHDLMRTLKGELHIDTSTEDLVVWTSKQWPEARTSRGTMQSKIAIVGMSCRMPGGATDTEKFWELLESGLDVHRKIPADRFDVDTHYDPDGKRVNASHTAYGCFIDEPGLFDAPFFNMSPREAQQTDPMQRLALVTAYEALERAGYVANRTAATNLHRIGTFYGQASDDYREVNTAQEISTYFIPGGCRAFGPGRINYFFKFSDHSGLSHGHFLTKTPNACKTWDCEADGYCRADGIGSIVMKRLEDAEADNDNILGVILAAATNHSAEAVSITHPHAGAQAYLYRQVMNRAGVDPLDVSFVEMHGTGTQAGDLVEIKSITDVFAPTTRRRNSKQPLHIGAVKSNVGHGEAVAGVTALLKVLLMFQKSAIPPHVGIKNSINPGFSKDFEHRNLKIPFEKQPWPHVPGKKRIAVVNNFSAAGGNTTLAIEEPPIRERHQTDPRPSHVVAVSAKSKISLKGNLERFIAHLDSNPDISLSNLSYSTTARRYHHNYRVAISTSDAIHLRKQLASYSESVDSHKPIPSTGPPAVAFAFTGQGASYKSMNVELFHDSPDFRGHILRLDSLAQGQGFPSIIPAIDGSHPKDFSHSPVVTQLAIVCMEIALAKYWSSLGVKPNVVIGHSLGEYAAMHIAGVLSASDTIFLVGQRARLLEQKCRVGSHKMLAVRASQAEIEESAGGRVYEIACVNGPKDTVLSGTREEIDAVLEPLQSAGYRCIELDVAFDFHSEQIDPVLEEFEELASTGVQFQTPTIPIISPLLSKVIFDAKTVNASYLRLATRQTVNFFPALSMAEKISTIDETTVWVEIGPHPVCVGSVKSTLPSINVAVASLRRGENCWTTMAQAMGTLHCTGVMVDWVEFHRPFEGALRLLDLPTYSWNDKNYWIMYNGDWALTKGITFYDSEKAIAAAPASPVPKSALKTSTVQGIIMENIEGSAGQVTMQSDLMQTDFLAAANGHSMNGCGVVTSSIHADIAYTLGEYLHKELRPEVKKVNMNMANLEVLKGLVVRKNTSTPQLIQVSITTADIHTGVAELTWYNVQANGKVEDPFASAQIYYGDATEWLTSWTPITHLIQGRIEALERLASEGVANRFSNNMAYQLFANNLVDYAEKYRGMKSVVLHEFEAFADVALSTEKSGSWTIPPHFIDSVAHLAGFIMNVSDAVDTKANFCVTPGWNTMRFARPLIAGEKYRSYTKMIPTPEDSSIFVGDVYILQNDVIIGMVGGIKFRRYPRILLNRFFSPPDEEASKSRVSETPKVGAAASDGQSSNPAPTRPETSKRAEAPVSNATAPKVAPVDFTTAVAPKADVAKTPAAEQLAAAPVSDDCTVGKALALVANEGALELADLADDATFASLGIDSLMSLVIAEKFRDELGIAVRGSLFLEYPTVGDFKAWLEEYYG